MGTEPETLDLTPRSRSGVWGLACGIIGVVGAIPFVPQLEYVFAPLAVVLGILGSRDASRGKRGKGISAAAVVLGVLVIAYKIATAG